jgi:hypothetical protein
VTGATSRPEIDRVAARADASAFQRLAGRTLVVSGIVAGVGVAFLVAMFAAFAIGARETALVLGRINDVLILVGYLLAAPAVLALRALARPQAGWAGDVLASVGIAAIGAIVVLQSLLVAGTLTFEQQVGPVSVALLVLGAWFVVTGRIASAGGVLPGGARMGLLAATYVGYPVWALWLGRRLASGGAQSATMRSDAG